MVEDLQRTRWLVPVLLCVLPLLARATPDLPHGLPEDLLVALARVRADAHATRLETSTPVPVRAAQRILRARLRPRALRHVGEHDLWPRDWLYGRYRDAVAGRAIRGAPDRGAEMGGAAAAAELDSAARNATWWGTVCPQDSIFALWGLFSGISEDCLSLNVYAPAGPPPAGGWPMMVRARARRDGVHRVRAVADQRAYVRSSGSLEARSCLGLAGFLFMMAGMR